MGLLGAHESVSGGLHHAFDHIRAVGGESLQIFTRNQRQWRAAPVSDEEAAHTPVTRGSDKVGRNAPCPCGSGRKFKRCCGRAK